MPRYFFTIRGRDRVNNDLDGAKLADAQASAYEGTFTTNNKTLPR